MHLNYLVVVKKANEWLTVLKAKHNMTEVSVNFRNNSADFEYDEEELESYRDYADSGGGELALQEFYKTEEEKNSKVRIT